MDAVLKWIGIVGAAWLLLSILVAVAWAVGGRRIFRDRPVQPDTTIDIGDATDVVFTGDFDTDRRQLDRNRRGER